METDLNFYQLLLNEPQIVYDITEKSFDIPTACRRGRKFRRILLNKKVSGRGAFNKLLGNIEIELVQDIEKNIPGFSGIVFGATVVSFIYVLM